jgi:hypothetical protein
MLTSAEMDLIGKLGDCANDWLKLEAVHPSDNPGVLPTHSRAAEHDHGSLGNARLRGAVPAQSARHERAYGDELPMNAQRDKITRKSRGKSRVSRAENHAPYTLRVYTACVIFRWSPCAAACEVSLGRRVILSSEVAGVGKRVDECLSDAIKSARR